MKRTAVGELIRATHAARRTGVPIDGRRGKEVDDCRLPKMKCRAAGTGRRATRGRGVWIVEEPEGDESETRTLDALGAERRKKRDVLVDQGIDPYPARFDRTATAAELRARHGDLDADVRTGETVRMAGRLTSIRGHGRLSFATLHDFTGSVQLLMEDSSLTDQAKVVLANFDLGDWIGAEGEAITSRRGELSVDVTELWLLSKALRPLPDKWHGLAETDTRYRQREVDLLANPDSRRVFDIRFKAVAAFRRLLHLRGLRRGRDADPPTSGRRCLGQTVHDPRQRARHRSQPAYRSRAVPQAPGGGGIRTGVRDRPEFPERRRRHPAQPRVHRTRGLPGPRRCERRDGPHRTPHHRGGPGGHWPLELRGRRQTDRLEPSVAAPAAARLARGSGRPTAASK